ncbi:protein kinase [Streptosporangium lutulentum]
MQPLKADDPRRLGSIELVGRLGEGGQGIVYLGRGPADEQVAVKLLHHGLASDPEARTRFLREVSVAQRVARFCTASVLHADLAGSQPYIVSEYVPGPSLRQLVDKEGPRRGAALERLAISTATALSAIHRAGILHRDFKPANVLMGPEGPVVIDFGIARALDSPGTTATGTAMGTPSYLAPEQLRTSEVTSAADVFAWGVTMVFAATGKPAFGQDSIAVVMNRILTTEPDLGELEGMLRDLVAACLSKDPALRPTAEELVSYLMGAVSTHQVRRPTPTMISAPMPAQPGNPQQGGPRRATLSRATRSRGIRSNRALPRRATRSRVIRSNRVTPAGRPAAGSSPAGPSSTAGRPAARYAEGATAVRPPHRGKRDRGHARRGHGNRGRHPGQRRRPGADLDEDAHPDGGTAGSDVRPRRPVPGGEVRRDHGGRRRIPVGRGHSSPLQNTAAPSPQRTRKATTAPKPEAKTSTVSAPSPRPTSKPTVKPTVKPTATRIPTMTAKPTATSRPTATAKPTVKPTTAPQKPNPYTASAVCGSGYAQVDSHALGGAATIYLFYNSAAGQNCVVTMSRYEFPSKISMNAVLQVQGGASSSNPGNFTAYAGPVRLAAVKKCVIWGGSHGSLSWRSGWSHCG